MTRAFPPGLEQRLNQGALGGQDFLIIAVVPSGAEGSLVGQTLAGRTLTTAGVYRCLIPTSGIAASLQVYLKATWSGGTVSSDVDLLFHMSAWPTIPDKKGVTATTDGSLTTNTLQTAAIATINGEQYGIVDLTLSGTTSVVINTAEYNGK